MLGGQLDQRFARWARPWVLASWVSLTLGITLGSFWAYYELGWGGWWFWDPVENASFMPWLAATALIHSLAVTEKRGLFTQWTLLLSILTFSLSLLGTFLVRSGVLVSVHSFAADPTRGLFILGLLVFYIVGALLVYALKGQALKQSGGFNETSRESFLLINNALLVTTALLILLGTLWPLILEVFKWGQISVGPPYFNVAFMIPMLPLVFLVSVGAHAAWKYGALARRQRVLGGLALAALGGGSLLALSYHAPVSLLTVSGFWAGFLVIFSSAYLWWNEFRSATGVKSAALGMVIAHIGIGVFTIGVSGVSSFAIEKDVSLGVHDAVPLADYTVQFLGTHPVKGPNYDGVGGAFVVQRDATVLAQLETQKRVFHAGGSAMTHAAIHSGGGYELFLALGEDVGQGKWSVRLQYKPLVRLIWWGGVLMALGGLWALWFRAREGRA
jgi:cytochrome c-type biogenesis protein CcmF